MTTDTTQQATDQTQIVVDPVVPLVRIIREFDATPAKVFRGHTDPDLLARWLGPNGTQTEIDHFDCPTGGSYRYLSVLDGVEYAFRGCFHEIRPSELIVQTFTYEDVPDGISLEKLYFEDLGDDRTRLTTTSLMDTFEGRDELVASGMDIGVREGYERLDALLAR